MNKQDYLNPVTLQVKDLAELSRIQADICFNLDTLGKVLTADEAKKLKRVIITGCGDSYSAAGAMLAGFKKLSGLRKCNTPDIMDFCRFYTEEKICKGYAKDEVLVMSISFSGGADRVAEALEKANSLGITSLLITRTPDSKGGRAAKKIYDVATPAGLNTPGLRSYYASMVGITSIAAYIGLCNGTIDEKRFFEVKENIVNMTEKLLADFDRIDDLMFSEALRMKDLRKFEIIADWNEDYSAQFVEQKFIECSGSFCDHVNSEEFVHISFMFRLPKELGTVIMINKGDNSMSRMKASIYGCLAQGRPTLIVTDEDPEVFEQAAKADIDIVLYGNHLQFKGDNLKADKPVVCQIPTPPEQWMSPFVDFIPGALLAGYHAAVNEIKFFGRRYDFRAQTWDK